MIMTVVSIVQWIVALFLSHSLSSEAYWLRENPSMKARLKSPSRITAWGRFSDWHMLHTLSLWVFSQCKIINTEEPMAATPDRWTQDEEEWARRMGKLFPDSMWESFNRKKRTDSEKKSAWELCYKQTLLRSPAVWGGFMWCEWDRKLDSNVQFRDDQHPSDGTSVSRAERQPNTVLYVTQEGHLSVFRISVSRNVLPLACQGLLSPSETGLGSLEFFFPVHYELSKTLAESIHLQTRRGVFLDWWKCGRTAEMEAGSDRWDSLTAL